MVESHCPQEIVTDRLHLRRFRKEDLDTYAGIMGDHEIGKWFPKGEGYTREEAERSLNSILKHWDKHGFGIWAITDKEEELLLGRCGLNFITETSEVEVDFVLARHCWNRGYATEAAKAALVYGFGALQLDRIIALAKPENITSRRVIEKIGMRYVKNAEYWGINCAYYEISNAEYTRSHTHNGCSRTIDSTHTITDRTKRRDDETNDDEYVGGRIPQTPSFPNH